MKSLAATAVVGLLVGGAGLYLSGYVPWASAKSGDLVTQQETAARQTEFAAQPPLTLSLVSPDDVAPAVDQMGLPARDKEALLSTVNATPATPAAATPARTRLAWVTVWDSDAEDGDVVRIESNGLSRTITLSKQPLTIAVPVPADAIVKVTGVRDGEGGGITVGFASGPARATFPIMSVGQTLGLRVRVN